MTFLRIGIGYFDDVQAVISSGENSTAGLRGSTEEEQFASTPATVATPTTVGRNAGALPAHANHEPHSTAHPSPRSPRIAST